MSIIRKWPIVCIVITALLMQIIQSQSNSSNMMCNFFDTTNITAGYNPNSSIIFYDNVEYPSDKYQKYNYIIENGKNVTVSEHIRGCLCQIKICVRIKCFNSNGSFVNYTRDGAKCELYDGDNFIVPIISKTGEKENVTLKNLTNVAIIYERYSCKSAINRMDFTINATTGNAEFPVEISHRNYVLVFENESLEVAFCDAGASSDGHKAIVNGIIISFPFLILTILLYQFVKPLKSFTGKCIKRYLIILLVAYSTLYISKSYGNLQTLPCQCVGFTIVFSFLSAFLWLNVICYDICAQVTPCIDLFLIAEKNRLHLYSFYAWVLPFIATSVIILLNMLVSNAGEMDLMPTVTSELCSLKPNCGARIFFFLPLAIILSVNVIFFILTVYGFSKETFIGDRFNTKKMELKQSLIICVQFFLIMGIGWIMEIVFYFEEYGLDEFKSICDVFSASQGPIIFGLTIMRPSVRNYILKRFGNRNNWKLRNTTMTEATTSTEVKFTNKLNKH